MGRTEGVVRLKELLEHYRVLGEDFLSTFTSAFLLEEGDLSLDSEAAGARVVHYLAPEEGPLLAGRRKEADVVVHGANVSGRHAHLLPPAEEGESWQIVDLDSTNGTWVDGVRLPPGEPLSLRNLSVVSLGGGVGFLFLQAETCQRILQQLAGRDKRPGPEPLPEVEATVALPPNAFPELAAASPADEGEGLRLVCPPYAPVLLRPGTKIVIGRGSNEADLVLQSPEVSRRHAEVECSDEAVYVRDLGSSNGVYMGGVRLGSGAVELPPGHEVRIAGFTIVLRGELPDPSAETAVFSPTEELHNLEGRLEHLPLRDLLRGLVEASRSGTLRLEGSGLSGRVSVSEGVLWSAQASDDSHGRAALEALLAQTEGSFSLDPVPPEGERNLPEDAAACLEPS